MTLPRATRAPKAKAPGVQAVMCGVCGSLGGEEHWSSGAGRIQGDEAPTRRAERAKRIRLINRMLAATRTTVTDWQGRFYLVASPTGKQQVVDSLPHIWQAVQEMTGRGLDPLAQAERLGAEA